VNEKDKKRYLHTSIKLCKLVANSKVASEPEKESAIGKLKRLHEKRVAQVFVKTMKDVISS